jgi:hypothetical protein
VRRGKAIMLQKETDTKAVRKVEEVPRKSKGAFRLFEGRGESLPKGFVMNGGACGTASSVPRA